MKRVVLISLISIMVITMPMLTYAGTIVLSENTAQEIKAGSNIYIDELCAFTVKSTKVYDKFMNTESGDASEFIVISFDIINWKIEPLYLRTEMRANLEYDESFDFEPTYFWANPQGTYYCTGDGISIYVYNMDDSGTIRSNTSVLSSNYSEIKVSTRGYERLYYPEIDTFAYQKDLETQNTNYLYPSIDNSKTVFDPLVQRTMHYVFKVPNIVAKDEGLRLLTISIGGNDYQLRF